jgi:hypothetical protein
MRRVRPPTGLHISTIIDLYGCAEIDSDPGAADRMLAGRGVAASPKNASKARPARRPFRKSLILGKKLERETGFEPAGLSCFCISY